MKILEILKSEPDETVSRMIDAHKEGNEVKVVRLYEGADYDALVEDIFAHEKVICWW